MAGYYIHLAACNPEARKNLSFVRGVEAPDILKVYFKLYGAEGAREKYNSLKLEGMPEYDRLEERVLQEEKIGSKTGLHYGVSSKPDVWMFWNSLTSEEKKNPFYRGYVWHLLTDLTIYAMLKIEYKYAYVLGVNKYHPDMEAFQREELNKLHADWDKTNSKVRDTYPDVVLPPEVEELGVVRFIEDDYFDYVDWETVKTTIDYFREFDPLDDSTDIERIIVSTLEYIKKHK